MEPYFLYKVKIADDNTVTYEELMEGEMLP